LKLKTVDVLTLNETKLDSTKPLSFYKNRNYTMIRRDRCFGDIQKKSNKGGGLIIFVNNKHKILNEFKSPAFELICLKLDLSLPLVIAGDLNMNLDIELNGNLVSPNGQLLYDF